MSHPHTTLSEPSSPKQNSLPSFRYILVKQDYPYGLCSHLPHRATKDSYATLEEARISITEYLGKNYTRSQQLGEPPGGLCGYEAGVEKCLGMEGGEVLGRVWVEKVRW